jgi:hypothetical protein
MVDDEPLAEREAELTDLQQDGIEEFINTLAQANVSEVIDATYKSGFTHEFRSEVADDLGCAVETVTRAVTRNPEIVLWRANEAGLTQSTVDELRAQLNADSDDSDGASEDDSTEEADEIVTESPSSNDNGSSEGEDAERFPVAPGQQRNRTPAGHPPQPASDRTIAVRVIGVLVGIVALLYLTRRMIGRVWQR